MPITVPGGGTVLKNTVLQTQIGPKPPIASQPLQVEPVTELPDVPVMPETLLLLDLKIQERCVDLSEVSQLVLADLGAVLQILRLAGREYGNAEGCPTRIEDCISDLGLQACFQAASAQTIPRDSRQRLIAKTWAHASEIARYSKLIAEETPDMNPDEAYLAGLLHVLGLLPSVLGWNTRESKAVDGALVGFCIAKRWSLPPYIVGLFSESSLSEDGTRWAGVVHMAHQRANRSSVNCSFEQHLRPRLHKRA